MTKEVLVRIAGLHFDLKENGETDLQEAEDEKIEIVVPGQYFLKNGKHYILYEEIEESGLGVTKNTLKVTGDYRVEMKKSGVLTSYMVFEKGKKYVSSYKTPFVRYTLEAEDEAVAESRIRIEVVPRECAFSA